MRPSNATGATLAPRAGHRRREVACRRHGARTHALAASLAALLLTRPAFAQPSNPTAQAKPDPIDVKALLRSLDEAGREYATAKKLLARGRAAAALAAIKRPSSELLSDRISLLRGDALLALGQGAAAKEAYQQGQREAKSEPVRLRALRGLANVHGALGEREAQLETIDALLEVRAIGRRANLMLEKASVLGRIGRNKEAAEGAWRVMLDYPTSRAATEAEQLLQKLKKKGVAAPVSSGRLELARIENLIRSGDVDRADKALNELEKKNADLAPAIALDRSEIMKRRHQRPEEIAQLEKLIAIKSLDPTLEVDALDRLGHAAMATDDLERATQAFDKMAERFPKNSKTAEAQFLASWMLYNKQRYPEASSRFLEFAEKFRRWKRRPEALWFAGWSAYLGKDFALARRAWSQLLEEHPGSDMALWAHYWSGRIKEQDGDREGAATAYRNVLRMAPLSYQSGWASARLEKLGEKVVMTPPVAEPPATLEQTLRMLGATRPVGVDRGIALERSGIEDEAMEEIDAAFGELSKIRDTRGRVMVAEMLQSLGSHYNAFRLATMITADGADLITGEPYAWRAWRLAYPKAFWPEVQKAGEVHGIDPLFILSIMRTESHFRPQVRSLVGARGLMQIMPGTAKLIGKTATGGKVHAARYTTPESNIWLGAWYLKSLLDRYDGQIALAAGAYNAGPSAMDRWAATGANSELDAFVESISYRETRMYIRRVLETYQIYRRLDAAPGLDFAAAVKGDTKASAATF